jgi:diguanylate cyclase (GGDEF)-like protein
MDPLLLTLAFGGGALAVLLVLGLFRLARRPARSEPVPETERPSRDLVDGHRPPEWRSLACQLLGMLRAALGAEGAVCLLPEGQGWRVAAASPGLKAAASVARREGLLVLALEGGQEVTAESVHPAALGYLPGLTDQMAVAFVPLLHRGKPRGLVAVHRPAGRPFQPAETALASRCAHLFDAWETYAAHLDLLAARSDEADRLARALEDLLGHREPREMAGRILDHLFDLLPAVYGYTILYSNVYREAYIESKRFEVPETFDFVDRSTWTYWVLLKGRETLYLEGPASRETAMPVLFEGEPFPPGSVVYLHPLTSGEEIFGVVGVVGKEETPFSEEGRRAAGRLIGQAAALIHLALLKNYQEKYATRDGLTDLYNRRHFDMEFPKELSRAQREAKPLSLLMIDLDHFKAVNDTFGHPAGDVVLKEVTQAIRKELREIDLLCRYGGEEFCAVLPGCASGEAVAVAERIRAAVEALPWGGRTPLPAAVTVSVGVATFPRPHATPQALLKAADEALYVAKKRGRNRVAAV